MNVTDFYPVFYTDDIETETKRFTEDFGFEVKHKPNVEYLDYVVLENGQHRRVDLVCSHFPTDSFKDGFLGMRANVDDFEQAVSYFGTQGYALFGEVHETESSLMALLAKGDGPYLVLFHHKK